METSNRVQTYAVAGLVVIVIALLPTLYRAMRSGSQSTLEMLALVSALFTAVGVIVLATQFGSLLSQFAKQSEREALYLSIVTAHDGGTLPPFGEGRLLAMFKRAERINDAKRARAFAPDPIDYVDDLPFVGNAHADRLATPSPSLREQFAAAPVYAYDGATSRPDDWIDSFTGSLDEFLATELLAEVDAHNAAMTERLYGDDYEPYPLDANGDEVGPGWRDVTPSAQA
ncbi:hypothetical protein LC55x_2718 [Lysobacter capsici]|uniref:hypothetical protein n=1 Tax=Lysobacter capsici TaxID=435897 RepID=UPI0007224576|nr:hypothetical protein [Lysobacter capsici]ALN85983.1 hypothetical protein LC55x_2718 [Lysobacter capsici]